MSKVGTSGEVETPRAWRRAMWATTVVACLGIAVLLFEVVTDFDLLALLVAGVLLLVAGVAWMVLGPIGCAKYREYLAVAAAPIVVGLGLGLAFSGLPDRLAWRLSEGSMTRAAQECSDRGGWFGVMRVDNVYRTDGGCVFAIYATDGGVAYFAPGTAPPDGPPQPYSHVYEPFAPNWYRFSTPIMHD
ncbi:hypothetical protein ACFWUP_01240 [Nocardia sp. NPDC058658]|uniref:hypothetical protein n=1 Tax=Nocardia sp. NPDC058658 TaxID=3346580 RepID=UPI0036597DB1